MIYRFCCNYTSNIICREYLLILDLRLYVHGFLEKCVKGAHVHIKLGGRFVFLNNFIKFLYQQ